MRTYVSDIIPRISAYSKKLDNITLLTNQHWVLLDPIGTETKTFIFRRNNELLISNRGRVEEGMWDIISNQSILLEFGEGSFLFNHGFLDQNVLALNLKNTPEFVFFINEERYEKELNSISKVERFLNQSYSHSQPGQNSNNKDNLKEFESSQASNIAFASLFFMLVLVIIVIVLMSL